MASIMTASGGPQCLGSLLSLSQLSSPLGDLILGHTCPIWARATLTSAVPAKRANLTPQDLVKCLVMALSDQTWVPCSLLGSPMQRCGWKVGAVAPQRKPGMLLPKPGHADIEQGSWWLSALRHCTGPWGWGPAEPGKHTATRGSRLCAPHPLPLLDILSPSRPLRCCCG